MSGEWFRSAVEALDGGLVHFLWQGMMIAVVLWFALELATRARPQARYAMSGTAIMVMFGWALITFGSEYSSRSRIELPVGTEVGKPSIELDAVAHTATSDHDGRYQVTLPRASTTSWIRTSYQADGFTHLQVEGRKSKIILSRGVLVRGRVLSTGSKPAAGVKVEFKNERDRYLLPRFGNSGVGGFLNQIRLNPGKYKLVTSSRLYRAVKNLADLLLSSEKSMAKDGAGICLSAPKKGSIECTRGFPIHLKIPDYG